MFIKHGVTLQGCSNRVWAYFLSEKGKLALENLVVKQEIIEHAINKRSDHNFRIQLLESTIDFMNESLENSFINTYFLKLCLLIQGLDTKRAWRKSHFRGAVTIAPHHGDIFNMAWHKVLDEKLLFSRGGGWYKRGLRH